MSSTTLEKEPKANPLLNKIVLNVLKALGTPPGYYQTKASNVFENRWRVDVWATVEQSNTSTIAQTVITDSFFVVADEQGKVVSPIITKKYGDN
jgi:hypothetical protein